MTTRRNTALQRSEHLVNNGRTLILAGDIYRGYLELARGYEEIRPLRRGGIADAIRSLKPDESAVAVIALGLKAESDYIDRVLSIGEIFQVEELHLILNKRLNVRLVQRLLEECFFVILDLDMDEIDKLINRRITQSGSRRLNRLFISQR